MALDHEPHIRNARKAVARFDACRDGRELGGEAVKAVSALRVLLYEPADGWQPEADA